MIHWTELTESGPITLCSDCDGEVKNVRAGEDEILSVCTGCRNIEQDTYSAYETKSGDWISEKLVDWSGQ